MYFRSTGVLRKDTIRMGNKDSLSKDEHKNEHKKGEVISGNKVTLYIGGKVVGTATSDDYETY